MIRLTLVVTSVYAICCMMALGQSPPLDHDTAAADARDAKMDAKPPEAPRRRKAKPPIIGSAMDAQIDPVASYAAANLIAAPKRQPRTLKKHDLVTIIIREESQSSSKGTTDLQKSSDLDAKVDAYVKLNFKKMSIDPKLPTLVPELKAEASRNTKGEATVDRSDSLTTRLGGEVIDVKPNGTLVLQAHAHIKVDDDEQDILISGVCRAEDVTPDNTVLSNILGDLQVVKKGKGKATDTTTPGIIPRILNRINLF